MPNTGSNKVDERIVRLKFDQSKFKEGIKSAISSLDLLKSKLKFGKDAQEAFKGIQYQADNIDLGALSRSVDSISSRFSTMGIIGTTVLVNLANAAVNTGKKIISSVIGPLTSGGLNRAMNIEQARFKLQGLGITGEELAKVWKNVSDAVDGTAYSLDAAAITASQFAASGLRGGKEMATALRAVSGVASVTGSSYEDIGRIFSQIAGQGRLMGNDLLQLSTRGMNVAAELGKQMGKTEAEIREMVSKGKIDFKSFAAAMNSAFGDQAMKANETLTGVLANCRSALAKIGADFFTPFITNASTEGHVSNLVEMFNAIRESINHVRAALGPLIEALQKPFLAGIQGITKFLNKFNELTTGTEKVKKKIEETTGATKEATKSLEDMAKEVIRGQWGNGAERIKRLTDANYDYAKIQNVVNEMMHGTYKATEETTKAIYGQTGAVEKHAKVVEEEGKRLLNWRDAMAQGLANIVTAITKPLEAISSAFGEVFGIKDSVNTINLLTNAFERLTRLLIPNEKVLIGIHDTAKFIFSTFKNGAKLVAPAFQVALIVVEKLGSACQWVVGHVLNLTRVFSQLLSLPFEFFSNILTRLNKNMDFKLAVRNFKTASDNFKKIFDTLYNSVKNFFTAIGGPFEAIGKKMDFIQNRLEGGIASKLSKVLRFISEAIMDLSGLMSKFVDNHGAEFVVWFKEAGNLIGTVFGTPVKLAIELLQKLANAIKEFTKGSKKQLSDWSKKAGSALKDWSKNFSFNDWTKNTIKILKDWCNNALDQIRRFTKEPIKDFNNYKTSTTASISKWSAETKSIIRAWAEENCPRVVSFFDKTNEAARNWSSSFGENIKSGFDKIKGFLKENASIENIKLNFENFFKGIKDGKLLDTIKEHVSNVFDFLKTCFEEGFDLLVESLIPDGIHSLSGLFNAIFDGVLDFIDMSVLDNLVRIGDMLGRFLNGLNDVLGKIDISNFSKIVKVVSMISGIRILWKAGDMFSGIGRMTKSVGTFFQNIENILDGKLLKTKPTRIQQLSTAFESLGKAIVNIAGAIFVLSLIDYAKVANGLGAMLGILGEIGVFMVGTSFAMNKIGGGKEGASSFSELAKSILHIAVGIMALSKAAAMFSKMDWKELAKGLAAITVGLGAIGGAMWLIGNGTKGGGSYKKVASSVISLAASLLILQAAVRAFAGIDTGELIKGGAAVAVALGAIAGVMHIIGKSTSGYKRAGLAIIALAASIYLLIPAIKILAGMKFDELKQGGLAVAGMLVALGTATRIAGTASAGAAIPILALAISMKLLVEPIQTLGKMDMYQLAQGITAVATVILALGFAASLVGSGTSWAGVAAIAALSAGLLLLTIPIKLLCGEEPWKVAATITELGLAIAALVGLGAIASAFSVGLLAIAVAAVGVGAGAALCAAAIWLIADAISKVGDLAPGAGSKLIQFLKEFASGIAQNGYEIGYNLMLGFIKGIIGGLGGVIGAIVDTGKAVINWFADILGIHSPSTVAYGFGINWDEGAGLGITDGSHYITDALGSLEGDITSSMDYLPEEFKSMGLEGMMSYTSGLGDGTSGVTSLFDSMNGDMGISMDQLTQTLGQGGYNNGVSYVQSFQSGSADLHQVAVDEANATIENINAQDQKFYDAGYRQSKLMGDGFKDADANTSIADLMQKKMDKNNAVVDQYEEKFLKAGERLAIALINGFNEANNLDAEALKFIQTLSEKIEFHSAYTEGPETAGKQFAVRIIDGMKNSFNDPSMIVPLYESLSTTLESQKDQFLSIGERVGSSYIEGLNTNLTSGFITVQTSLENGISQITESALAILQNNVSNFKKKGESLIQSLGNGITGMQTHITSVLSTLLSNAESQISNKSSAFRQRGSGLIKNLASGMGQVSMSVRTTVQTIVNNALSQTNGLSWSFYTAGQDCMRGLINGMNSMSYNVWGTAYEIGRSALRAAKQAVQSHSPSKKFEELGIFCDQGFINGFNKLSANVKNSAKDVAIGAYQAATSAINRFNNLFDDAIVAEPVIAPVVDLSHVEKGAQDINRIMSGRQFVFTESARMANQTAVTMNDYQIASRRNQNDDPSNKPTDEKQNNITLNMTFNITGDDPKSIAEEVARIIQKEIERKEKVWA